MGVWPSVVGVTRNTASTVGRGLKDLEALETPRRGAFAVWVTGGNRCARRIADCTMI